MITLSTLSVILGILLLGSSAFVFAKPETCKRFLLAFPRSLPWGYLFLVVSSVWFLCHFQNEDITDFAQMKRPMFVLFIVLAIGVGLYVRDFLAVRTYSIFLFLVAKLIYDTARYADSSWAVLFPSVATILVFFGIWFTATPWKMRDLLNWISASTLRLKALAGARAVLGLAFLILGILKIH